MGRNVDVDDLVDVRMIAERLGLAHPQSAGNLALRHPDFPEPLGMWGRTRLWAWSDVEAWARRTGRLEQR